MWNLRFDTKVQCYRQRSHVISSHVKWRFSAIRPEVDDDGSRTLSRLGGMEALVGNRAESKSSKPQNESMSKAWRHQEIVEDGVIHLYSNPGLDM